MQRTLYTDGVEVDESDLDNTENTKISEILLTRTQLSRFGVIEGLTLSIVNNSVTVGIGKASLFNGEIINLTTPLTNIVGAAFDAGKSSFFGLRLTEVTSNPKPHEVDPVTFDTRATPQVVGEFFVAADTTDAGRTAAKTNALNAQVIDGNFILLGEFVGTGTGIALKQNTPLVRTKGGDQPNQGVNPKTRQQIASLQNLYESPANNEFPIHSAKDEFHRSLIGTGIPTTNNPHGLTLTDIGGDVKFQEHLANEHSNGLIGFEPADDDFTPISGSFAFSVANAPTNTVTVNGISSSETLLINGVRFDTSAIGTTSILFTGQQAGLYYIVAKAGSDSNGLQVLAMKKGDLDALVPLNNGIPEWLNNALEFSNVSGKNEKKFFAIGLVFWDGSTTFRSISDFGNFKIPAPNGSITYTPFDPSSPFFVPPGKPTLDLRRYGTITNANVQKRTLQLDRLVVPVTPLSMFVAHAGSAAQNLTGTAGQRATAAAGVQAGNLYGGDQTILKHLTDFDANNLFGHRGGRGAIQHGAVINVDPPNVAPPDRPENYGFQTNQDKWKQDNLTMTILKWSDLTDITGGTRGMGDAGATSGDFLLSYVFGRSGSIQNIFAQLAHPSTVGTLTVILVIRGQQITLFTFPTNGPPNQILYAPGPFPFLATPSVPVTIGMARQKTGGGQYDGRNLTVTAEYHYVA